MASLFKRRNGVWYLKYRDWNGRLRKKSLRTRNKKYALILLQHEEQQLIAQRVGLATDLPLQEAIAQYLAYAEIHKAPATFQEDRLTLLQRLPPTLPDGVKTLQAVRPAHVEAYVAARKAQGVSNARINRELTTLKAFFSYFLKRKHLVNHPCAGIRPLPEVRLKTVPSFFREDEVTEILTRALGTRWEGPLTLAANLGLREGEIAFLTRDDIDRANGLLHIRAKAGFTPKDYEERTLPLNRACLAFLDRWLARPEAAFSPYLFPDEHGQPNARALSVGVSRFLRGLGFRGGLRKLRHTFASYQAMAGTDLKTLQAALGHADPRTMQRYVHLLPEHQQRLTERVVFQPKGVPKVVALTAKKKQVGLNLGNTH